MPESPTTLEEIVSGPGDPLLWLVTDGKAGHENQTLALAKNLQELAPFRIHLAGKSLREMRKTRDQPALVIGTGHRTHLPLLAAARHFECPSVVIMKPTIPTVFFDLCFIPEHDLKKPPASHVVPTKGMLNLLPVAVPPKKDRGLILVGGPSRHHGFEGRTLARAIQRIITDRPGLSWDLTDSRRTPGEFRREISKLDLRFHPAEECPAGWLLDSMLASREIWVTEDSMSMIYEALTAQAKVGLLPMPRKSRQGRIARSIDRLVAEGWTCFPDPEELPAPPNPPTTLHEASRCARELLKRYPALA
ncbi:MAG: hypothetical protein CMO40_06675 [Verrucomicrobiaceae bacterium]|nr:hypothetical protein [Verrucomicrobiaceae bacterium]